MANSVKDGENPITIDQDGNPVNETSDPDDPNPPSKQRRLPLNTVGAIITERAKIYRKIARLNVDTPKGKDQLVKLKTQSQILDSLRQDHDVALQHRIRTDDDTDDRPALVGLAIEGPEPQLPEGATARRLDRKAIEPPEAKEDDNAKDNQGRS